MLRKEFLGASFLRDEGLGEDLNWCSELFSGLASSVIWGLRRGVVTPKKLKSQLQAVTYDDGSKRSRFRY